MFWNLDKSEKTQRDPAALNLATWRTVRMPRAPWTVAVAAVAFAVLTGCAPIEGEPTGTTQGGGNARPAAAATTAPPRPAEEQSWGESYSYDDGLTITVGEPRVMADPGEGVRWADYLENSPEIDMAKVMPVRIELTVTNGGRKMIDPAFAKLSLLAAGAPVDAGCIDADCAISVNNLGPRLSVTAHWMWWVPRADADDLTIEATGGPAYDRALWRGSVPTD